MSDLITTETFHEIPVRIVQGENGPMIPLVDIAAGIGYSKQAINQLYERNKELLKDDAQDNVMITGDQIAPTPHICLSRDGVIGLLMKTDYIRIKAPVKREKILSFQKWAKTTLGKVMDGNLQSSQPALPPISDALHEEMARADALRIVGVDIGLAASVCMAKLEEEYQVDLSYLRGLLSRKDSRDIPYLTATAIGKILNLSAQSVNNVLESSGYQKHSERIKKTGVKARIWNLTDKGRLYGEVHIERHGGSQVYTILWRDAIIEELRNVLFYREKSQQGLLMGECGV